MSEEEKKAIEIVQGLKVYYDNECLLDEEEIEENNEVNNAINLVVELAKSNGFDKGLYGLLMKEEEKNKELEEKLKIATAMLTRGTYPEQNEGDNDFDNHFIRKDKIKEKRDELIYKERTSKLEMGNLYRYGIAVLNSVLEEK